MIFLFSLKKLAKCFIEHQILAHKQNNSQNFSNVSGGSHILIDGISGCGKTYLAQCLSGHFSVPLLTIDCSTDVSTDYKLSYQLFLSVLNFLKSSEKTIVLLDNIDSLLSNQEHDSHDNSSKMSSQLVSFIDKISSSTDALIIATASSIVNIDAFITR